MINVCKEFLPSTAKSFDDEKVKLHIGDGFAFMKAHTNEFDVIISDTSDPAGDSTILLFPTVWMNEVVFH